MKWGIAFSDSISISKSTKRFKVAHDSSYYNESRATWRIYFFYCIFAICFIILVARLFHLTIINGSHNLLLSEANRTRERFIQAPRGIIFDRNSVPMVHNIPIYSLFSSDYCNQNSNCEAPLSIEQARTLEANHDLRLRLRISRKYPFSWQSAHVVGFVGQVNQEELANFAKQCQGNSCAYRNGDWIGRVGAEKVFDTTLRGIDGRELVEVDSNARAIRDLGRLEPTKGGNVYLNIDSNLQALAASSLASSAGAIVATVPQTGEVLALYSGPSFDPNLFAMGDEQVSSILQDPDKPLYNRVVSGVYPPGSTFKIVTATAGLEEGKITESTQIEDVGVIAIGPYRFPNWYFIQYGKTDGLVNIIRALTRSNDIFFYKTGELVGIDGLNMWAKRFGLGGKTGIDLPSEEPGVFPDSAWKQRKRGEAWFLGDTYHVSIGQGDVLVTPLQVNAWTNVIASGGKLCRPHILSDLGHLGNLSNLCNDLNLKKETLELIKQGMKGACQPGGTGWPLFKFKVHPSADGSKFKVDGVDFLASSESSGSAQSWVEIPIACKTGTAEYGDPKGKTHAWFTSFAPVENPQLSITVLVEGAGEGSSVAAPIAKKLYEYWFSR